MSILAIIFFAFLVAFFIKVPIKFSIIQKNFEGKIFLKSTFFTYKKNFAIVGRKKEHIIPSRKKNKILNRISIKDFIENVEIEYLNINSNVGLLFMWSTLFIVPIISTFLEIVKYKSFKRVKKYSYIVLPNYEERFSLYVKIDGLVKISAFDAIKLLTKQKKTSKM